MDYETLLLPPPALLPSAILDHPDHPDHPPSQAYSCQTEDRGSSFILSGPTLAVVVLSFVTGLSQLHEARLGTMGGDSEGCLLADSLRFSAIRGERVTARSTQFGLLLVWQSLLGEWSG
ncbi:hypothetical protein PtA15_17A221 [Puccinia triticina]|uniref:Uncharacterized protein n=1 Tax=Puccinia triticina TaxID=208348 RepID=A0ABY7D7K3_9BASI|nr:uncharacterized protein PtA15_17A221 [Puccinia triticina]WAQ92739.1 hypothetical protein PtA15_17A221 [Puccinia triticina]